MRSVCFRSRNCDGSDTIIARARVLKTTPIQLPRARTQGGLAHVDVR